MQSHAHCAKAEVCHKNKIAAADKRRLFEAYQRGDDYQILARQLGIKRQTAWAIIRRALNNHGEVERPRGGFRHRKMTEEMTAAAVEIIEEHSAFTLQQINEELQIRLPDAPQVYVNIIFST